MFIWHEWPAFFRGRLKVLYHLGNYPPHTKRTKFGLDSTTHSSPPMRDVLPEFYRPSENDFKALWRSATFAFDANVLLDIHRYSPDTRKQLIAILTELGGRVFVPYQAAYEYQWTWRSVVPSLMKAYDAATGKLDALLEELKKGLSKYNDTDTQLKQIAQALEAAKASITNTKSMHEKQVPTVALHDQLTALLTGKVGEPYSDTDLKKKRDEAKSRIAQQIPPGYKDGGKKDNADGDVILWFQLLDFAKQSKKPLIFVTGDAKEDWWLIEGGQTLLPRPELRKEMRTVASVDFYMYSTPGFLKYARDLLGIKVSDEAIKEARAVETEDRTAAEFPLKHVYTPQAFKQIVQMRSRPDLAKLAALLNQYVHKARTFVDDSGATISVRATMNYRVNDDGSSAPYAVLEFTDGQHTTGLLKYPSDWFIMDDNGLKELYSLSKLSLSE